MSVSHGQSRLILFSMNVRRRQRRLTFLSTDPSTKLVYEFVDKKVSAVLAQPIAKWTTLLPPSAAEAERWQLRGGLALRGVLFLQIAP